MKMFGKKLFYYYCLFVIEKIDQKLLKKVPKIIEKSYLSNNFFTGSLIKKIKQ